MAVLSLVGLGRRLVVTSSLCALVLACESSSDPSEGGQAASQPAKPSSPAKICEASCTAQAKLKCPRDPGYNACYDACIDPTSCSTEYLDVNWCMANAPLSCDGQGYAAVSTNDCGPQIDRFGKCLK